jgi:hypothetical protein
MLNTTMESLPIFLKINGYLSQAVYKEEGLFHVFFILENKDIVHAHSHDVESLVEEAISSFEEYYSFCEELE